MFIAKYTKILSRILVIVFTVLALVSHARAISKKVELTSTVPAGTWKTVRLRSLPAGGGLKIEAESDAPMTLVLTNRVGFSSYPDPPKPPLFKGEVIVSLGFTVRIPRAENYYLLLDNRSGRKEQAVRLQIEASPTFEEIEQLSPTQSPPQTGIESKLREFVEQVQKIFVFDTFGFSLRDCRQLPGPQQRSSVTVCTDQLRELDRKFSGDGAQATDILIFALLHEVGHQLLYQWQYPFADNGEIANDFAVVLLVILRQEQRLNHVIRYLEENGDGSALLAGLFADHRHGTDLYAPGALSVCRDDKEKRKRWLKFLLPHLQPGMLDKLRKQIAPDLNPRESENKDRELKI